MQATPPALALKQRHRAVLSAALSTHASASPPWHVLIADDAAHAMLSALFTPPELRAFAVTLVQHLSAARAAVPDVPAHFVLAPTAENVARVARDLSGPTPRYASAHVSFTTAVPAPLLAALAAQLPLPSPLARVRDLHAAFLTLQPRLFTLQAPVAYAAAAAARDEPAVRALVDPLVDGLFSVCVTLGVVPIIRAQRAGPAEAVAAALDARLREGLPLFARAPPRAHAFRRPLLLLLDRDLDHAPMLHHAWTYQALAHDCLPLRGNELTLPAASGVTGAAAARQKPRVYAVDPEKDEFWRRHAASPFPQVAEAVEQSLTQYRSDVERLNARAVTGEGDDGGGGGGGGAAVTGGRAKGGGGGDDAGRLADAIASLPDLSRQKEAIDKHTNIATALLSHINARALDAFFELESQLLAEPAQGSAQAATTFKPAVLDMLRTGGGRRDGEDTEEAADVAEKKREAARGGTPADRLRLFLIYYERFGQALTEEDMVEFRDALAAAGAELSVIDHVGRKRGFRHDAAPPAQRSVVPLAKAAASLNAGKLRGLMHSVVSSGVRGIAGVAQSAKQLVVRPRSPFAAARTLELFMGERGRDAADAADVLDGFLLFDPKLAPAGGNVLAAGAAAAQGRPGAQRSVFAEAIVFVVGGGNYVEFEDCMRVADAGDKERTVLYGATELLTPASFVKQLAAVATLPQ